MTVKNTMSGSGGESLLPRGRSFGLHHVSWLRGGGEGEILVPILAIIVALLVVPPLIYLLVGSFYSIDAAGGRGELSLSNYARVLLTAKLATSVWNSVVFAAGSAMVALFLGGLQAWLVERTNTPFKWLAYLGAIISLAIPYALYVVAAMFAFGPLGPISAMLTLLFGPGAALPELNSMAGMILVEGLLWAPLVFLMLSPVFRAADPSLEEAALTCGASQASTLFRVSLRLVTPAVLAVLLLVFIKAIGAFEVPAMMGLPTGVNVLTTEIYLQLKMSMPPDLGRASAFAVLLVLIVAFLLRAYQRILRQAERYRTIVGKAYRPRLTDLRNGRWASAAALAVCFILTVGLPLVSLVWASLMPFYQAMSLRGLQRITLENYSNVLANSGDLTIVWNTLLLAGSTATAAMALSLVVGWVIARNRRGAWLIDQLGAVPLVVPGLVLAVAIMQVFLSVPVPIYGTMWILLIAFSIRFLPYGLRYSTAGILQIDSEMEEAAAANGASLASRFIRVVVPLVIPAFVSGWLFIMLLVARDLAMPVLLASPHSRVVAVQLFDLWQNGQVTELAAFGLLWTLIMSAVAAIFFYVASWLSNSPSETG
ncbi:ABC transporter permease [Pseudochelatococcus sp. B33]